jgi:hypothetical protein
MHGLTNPRFINAKQAGEIYSHKNIKRKLHKTVVAIWFNKTYRDKELKPNYIDIRINGNNKQCDNTITAAVRLGLNLEIKFLYIKKKPHNRPDHEHSTAITTIRR